MANEVLFREINEMKRLLKEEREKNDKLMMAVNELIKDKEQLQNKVEYLLEWKKSFDKKDDKKVYEKKVYENANINSKIFDKKEEVELISNKLKNKIIPKPKNVKYNLLYRASRDGDRPIDYHKKCDGRANTLCAIKTKKGCKFGGYTETEINKSFKEYLDPNSFIFSLNKMKIYENKKKDDYVVCHSGTWGPIFRGGFSIADKNFFSYKEDKKDKIKSNNDSPFFELSDEEFEINNGEEYFTIDDLEIFQLLFN